MRRAIYEDDVIKLLDKGWKSGVYPVASNVHALPSAQPEIIRCKDCKYLQKWRSEESAKKFGQIYECARNVFDCPKPEDFCSHAEKRTAQPERKRGKWTKENACEFCGFQPWFERDIHTLSFCPNCGADMREGQDG